jgi:hypothetical protein
MSLTFWIFIVVLAGLTIWRLSRLFAGGSGAGGYTPQDDERQLEILAPYFRREVVEAKVKSVFPNHDPAEILQLLDDGLPAWALERMQLNIIKLSNGDVDQLRYYIDLAKSERDFIKVMELAENPQSSGVDINDPNLFDRKHKRVIEKDFQQYLNWLKKK